MLGVRKESKNLVRNGGFDNYRLPAKCREVNDSKFGGWKLFHGKKFALCKKDDSGLRSDNKGNYLDVGATAGSHMDAVYQGIRTTRNQVYVLTFSVHAKDASLYDSDEETLLVKWDGEVLGRFKATDGSTWTRYHLMVIGTGGRVKLSFHKMVAGSDGPYLEDVSLHERNEMLVNGNFDEYIVQGRGYNVVKDTLLNGWHSLNGNPVELWRDGHRRVKSRHGGGTMLELDVRRNAEGHPLDGIYQEVVTKSDKQYLLTFFLHARNENLRTTDGEAAVVAWNGEKLGRYISTEPYGWTRHQVVVQGTGGSDKLSFEEMISDGSGPVLDDISLVEI